jgi:hypothetical protein
MFAYCSREKFFTRFLAVAKLLKRMVARDGIEPPTPAFSGFGSPVEDVATARSSKASGHSGICNPPLAFITSVSYPSP